MHFLFPHGIQKEEVGKETRDGMSLEEAQRLHNPTERSFAVSAIAAGFIVRRGQVIQAPKPVADRHGNRVKKVTHPDFNLSDGTNRAHVEVTNGRGNGGHKRAQFRVVKAAGVTNYHMINGKTVELLDELPADTKRTFLERILKW